MILLLLPFFSTLFIVMNIYNGDILGITENIEYLLWYIPLIIFIVHRLIKDDIKEFKLIPELILSLLAIIINVYWIYAWRNDQSTNFRHRTEYYDSQCLLCSLTFSILLNNYNYNKYYIKNKITLI